MSPTLFRQEGRRCWSSRRVYPRLLFQARTLAFPVFSALWRLPRWPTNFQPPLQSCNAAKRILTAQPLFETVVKTLQVPPFVQNIEKFKKSGVDEVYVVSVNDHHVMAAWADAMASHGKVHFLADPLGEFTRGVNQEIDLTAGGLGKRSQRYCFFAENGKVLHQMVEKSPGDLQESTADAMLNKLKRL